jgi:hypothetical protein
MCENTLLALKQVLDAMQNEGPMFLQDMNRTERRAFEELFGYCESFLTMSEELQDEYEREVREGTIGQYEEDCE